MNCNKAKKTSLLSYLKKLGNNPQKINNLEAWFLSPFREEKTPSFKINLRKNIWYDFGEGLGGTIIDLIMKLNKCSVSEALKALDDDISFSFHQQPVIVEKTELKIRAIKQIQHPALLKYLKVRKISSVIAKQYCKQVEYTFNGKFYFSIGLKNNSGGYELRNKFFKNSSSPKDITHIKNNKNKLIIIEGMFDFLSLLTIYPNQLLESDMIILNSISFIEKAKKIIAEYDKIELYLDNDNSGKKATNILRDFNANCIDKSSLRSSHNDLNEWLIANY